MSRLVRSFVSVAAAAVALAAAEVPDRSILIRHDRPDSAYIALGQRYGDILAHVEERVEGVVLRPRWVLTAAHAVETIGPFDDPYATIRGERYGIEKVIVHPEWEGGWDDLLSNHDLALLKLDRPVTEVRPIRLYRASDEHGTVLTILGRGATGTGATGRVGEKGSVVRGATNRVDGVSRTAMLMVFDGDEDATELEGAGGPGDSGGPALLERSDTLYLVGIGSAGTAHAGHAAYGSIGIYARVSAFASWIERTIAEDPPSTTDWSSPVRLGAEPSWPDTPVGRMAEDLFGAYPGGVQALERFHSRYGDPDTDGGGWAERIHAGLVEAFGPLRLHSLSTAGPYMIQVLVYSPARDAWRSIGLNTAPDPPHRLTRLYLKTEAPPR